MEWVSPADVNEQLHESLKSPSATIRSLLPISMMSHGIHTSRRRRSWIFTAQPNIEWPASDSFLAFHFWQDCRRNWRRRAGMYREKKFRPVRLESAVRKQEFTHCARR